jgi:DNA-binding SARP family transcriptional activator
MRGSKRRSLLGMLVLKAGHVLSADAAANQLWPGEPSGSAMASLQTAIYGLRKSLGAERDRLRTEPDGYALTIESRELDAQRFEGLLAAARERQPAQALGLLVEALGLWRGRALGDLADAEWALGEAARLDGLRLSALEQRIDAELAVGRHSQLVGELEVLVLEHPLRERFWGQLMTALYRNGRQAEALRAFQRLRSALGDELGIAPSPELVILERQVLAQDSALDASIHAQVDQPTRSHDAGLDAGPPAEATQRPDVGDGVVRALAVRGDLGPPALGGRGRPESAIAQSSDLAHSSSQPVPLGSTPLTGANRREDEVIWLAGENLMEAETTARLDISGQTVEPHVSSLLSESAAVAPVDVVPAMPPLPATLELLADASTFVGRRSERQLLRHQWQQACAGHTLFVLVSGEAGIGKTRLVSELATDVHADGGRVLLGACYEDVDHPYDPFAQVISADASELTDAEIGRRLQDDREALIRLSPGLVRALTSGGRADRRSDVDESERGLMLDAIEHWLAATASRVPLLLIVEDLHWSTSSTRNVLRHLVRKAGRHALLIVATTRDSAPDLDTDLAVLLADLERSPAVTRVRLRGLDPEDVAVLIGRSTVDAEAIVAETGGNPLLATHLSPDGVSGSLAVLLSRRDQLLDAETRALLDLAATFGSEFDADLLATGSGVQLMAVLESLEHAEAAGLVVPLPGRRAQFGFVHALFRSHRYQALAPRRRLEAHAAAAAALASRPGDHRLLSERARHACLALPLGDARTAVDLARDAAHLAEQAYAYDEAASHYRRGLDAACSLDPPDPAASLDLAVRLAAVLHHHGDPQGLPMLLDAARRAREAGDAAALVRVAISFSHFGTAAAVDWPDPAQLAVVEDALAVLSLESSAMKARVLIELAGQIGGVRVDESIELAREAESIARHIGDPDLLGSVLLGSRHVGRHPSRIAEYERIGVELEGLGQRRPSLALTLAGVSIQALAMLERGEVGQWMAGHQRFVRLLGDRTLPHFQLIALVNTASRAVLDGQFQTAEDLAMSIGRLASTIGRSLQASAGPIMLINRRLQARDVELVGPLEQTVHHGGDVSVYRCALAAVQARVGAVAEARRSLATLRSDGFRVPRGYAWALAMAELAEAAEVAADAATGAYVLSEIGPYSGRIATTGSGINRPLDQALAQAALASGDITLAEEYARRAVSASRQRATPVFLCRELVFLAEARRRAGASVRDVRPLVDEARTIANRVGGRVVLVDLERYALGS